MSMASTLEYRPRNTQSMARSCGTNPEIPRQRQVPKVFRWTIRWYGEYQEYWYRNTRSMPKWERRSTDPEISEYG